MNEFDFNESNKQGFRDIFDGERSLVEHIPDGLHILNGNGDLMYANLVFYRMLGYEAEDEKPKNIKDWDARWSPEEIPDVLARYMQENQLFLTRHKRKDGNCYDAEVNVLTFKQGEERFLYCAVRDVTKQQELAAELRASEERFRKFFYEDQAVKLLIDPATGQIVEANHAAANFYQYTADQLTHMKIQDINQLSPAEIQKEMQRAVLGKRNYFNFRHRLGSGEIRDVEVYSTALEIHQRNYLFSVIHDVTERVRAEKALQESEARHRELFTHAPVAISRCLPDGIILDVNLRFAQLFGYASPEDLLASGLHSTDLYANLQDRAEIWAEMVDASPLRREIVMLRRDRSKFLAHVTVQMVRDEDGIIKYVEAFIEDITQRRQAEVDLQAERDFAMTVMNTMGQGLTVIDGQGHFLYINQAYARISGYTLVDLMGKTPEDITYPADQAALLRAKTERKLGLTTSYEIRIERADGTLIPVLITGAPRWRGDGMDGAIAVITDLTERKRMETELTRMNERLELQLAEMRELQELLQEQAIRDPLTQLFNRRYLNEILPREVARAQRTNISLGVLMIDLDHFKNINDTYGHKAGDETLQAISQMIVINLRASDIVCRYGGEEILCLLVGTTEWVALRRADHLRKEISQLAVITTHPEVRVTVSIGVAIFTPKTMEINTVIKAADIALYRAKADGRNCVRMAE